MKEAAWYRNIVLKYKKNDGIIEMSAIRDESARVNLYRLYYVAMSAIVANTLHISIFWFYKSLYTKEEMKWRLIIVLCHIGVLVIMGAIFFVSYLFRKKEITNTQARVLSDITIVVAFLLGISITVMDQLVTLNVVPFLVVCTIMAVVFLMRPLFAAMVYTGALFIYYSALGLTQFNKEILLANRINGIAAGCIGFCLSMIVWRNHLLHFKQKKHIEMQKLSLEEKNEQLTNLNKVKDTLFTVIAHDIRGPLATLVNTMELLEEEIDTLSSDSLEIIEEVKLEIFGSYSMVDSLLDWCSSQKNGLIYKPSICNLYTIVEETACLAQSKADAKEIKIINKIKEDLTICVDREMFDLIIRNILNNALKFTSTGGNITMQAYISGEKTIVVIKDTGIGMDSETIENIFNGNSTNITLGTEGEKGMGLGLKLCKEFIQINGGDIWVDSAVGKGSVFFVSIPYVV